MAFHKPVLFLLALTAGILAFAPPAAAQPKPLVVLSRADLKAGVLYDAWVEFKDKGNPSPRERRAIWAALEKEFHPRALARRKANRGAGASGLFDERDEPLAEKYVRGVESMGAKLQIPSRWLNGVTVVADRAQIEKIMGLPYVKTVGDFHLRKPRAKASAAADRPAAASTPAAAGQGSPSFYGVSDAQILRLNLERLHAVGYRGRGIRVAVVDCGFDLSSEAFHYPDHPLRIAAQRDFVENDGGVQPRPDLDRGNYEHGTIVLGAIGAYFPGRVVGTAYDADFILANAEDGDEEYYLEERWFVAALEYAEKLGADIVTSSLVLYEGYQHAQTDGKTSVMTRGLNIATANGLICFSGAGNNGHDADPSTGTLMPPCDSADVIGVGAVRVDGTIAAFSCDGPTADGRLKPELLSQGLQVGTVSITDRKGIAYAGGTSLATPVLAGAGACLLQVHPEWTLREFRKALFESGDFFRREGKPDPAFVHGYGVPDVFLAAGLKNER
jgi:serine protease AprX